jgi:hypothetical protein
VRGVLAYPHDPCSRRRHAEAVVRVPARPTSDGLGLLPDPKHQEWPGETVLVRTVR